MGALIALVIIVTLIALPSLYATWSRIPCPRCGSLRSAYHLGYRSAPFRVCRDCGTVFTTSGTPIDEN